MEEYVPKRRTGQNHSRDLNETLVSYMPDREFEVMAMKILTGLEKRGEDLSETLNQETRH